MSKIVKQMLTSHVFHFKAVFYKYAGMLWTVFSQHYDFY